MFRFHCHFSILNYNPDTALLKRGFPPPVIKENPMEYPISFTAKTPCPFPVTCQAPGNCREFCSVYFSAGREKRIMKEEPGHPAFHGCAPAEFYGRPFRALSLLYLYSPEKEKNVPWKRNLPMREPRRCRLFLFENAGAGSSVSREPPIWQISYQRLPAPLLSLSSPDP